MTSKAKPDLRAAACMIINSIDNTANADPDTILRDRVTPTHIVIITHRGQKFSIPIGTVLAADQASRDADAERAQEPETTIKGGPAQPAKTVKKATRKRPATTRK